MFRKMFSNNPKISSTRILASILTLAAVVYLFVGDTQDKASILTALLTPAFGGRAIQTFSEYFGKNYEKDTE